MRPAKCHFGIDLFSTRFRFFFFSKEERRKHVHVSCGDGEAKFWLEPAIGWQKITSTHKTNGGSYEIGFCACRCIVPRRVCRRDRPGAATEPTTARACAQ